jgi:hypothetical protein
LVFKHRAGAFLFAVLVGRICIMHVLANNTTEISNKSTQCSELFVIIHNNTLSMLGLIRAFFLSALRVWAGEARGTDESGAGTTFFSSCPAIRATAGSAWGQGRERG